MILEAHVTNPHQSDIFRKYPRIVNNHHVTDFICGGLSPIIEGIAKPEQLPALMDAELKVIEDEHHAPLGVLQKTADALPGFGIVAAVLGIVITMGAIDGPVEEIGHKVGAALVGTFLGILMSYGFIGPLAGRMEFLGRRRTGVLPHDHHGDLGVCKRRAAEGGDRAGPPRRGNRGETEPRAGGSVVQGC